MSIDAPGKSLTGFELSYEDVEIGDHFETPSREVTAAIVEAFAEMTGDRFEIHMSDEAALRHGFFCNEINGYGGPGGTPLSTGNQYVGGWFANPFPSYSLVWSGEPSNQDEE